MERLRKAFEAPTQSKGLKWSLKPVPFRDQARYKWMPRGSVRVWDAGLKLSPDLVEGLDFANVKLAPYINEKTRLLGFKKSEEGYVVNYKVNKKSSTYFIRTGDLLELLVPAPKHMKMYRAFWDDDMLIIDFSKEMREKAG